MNWTGGALSRSRKPRGTLVDKQKEHFAKVRNNVLHSQKSTAPKHIEFFGKMVTMKPSYENQVPQNQLDMGESLAVVNDLEGRGRSKRRCARSSPRIQSEDGTVYSVPEERHHRKRRRSTSSEPVLEMPRKPDRSSRQRELVRKDDGELELLEARRRRLLDQGSWLKITPQPLPQLQYPRLDDTDKIGRRRQISSQEKTRGHLQKSRRLPSPFAQRSLAKNMHGGDTAGQGRVRIAIGSQEVRAGASSSTRTRRDVSLSNTISDVMLLDDEEDANEFPASDQHAPYPCDSTRMNSNTTALYDKVVAALARQQSSNNSSCSGGIIDSGSDVTRTPSYNRAKIIQPSFTSEKVLRSINALESAASDVAEVGGVKPVVSTSQASANNKWASWVHPAIDSDIAHPASLDGYDECHTISPGVSERPPRALARLAAMPRQRSSDQDAVNANNEHERTKSIVILVRSRSSSVRSFQNEIPPKVVEQVPEVVSSSEYEVVPATTRTSAQDAVIDISEEQGTAMQSRITTLFLDDCINTKNSRPAEVCTPTSNYRNAADDVVADPIVQPFAEFKSTKQVIATNAKPPLQEARQTMEVSRSNRKVDFSTMFGAKTWARNLPPKEAAPQKYSTIPISDTSGILASSLRLLPAQSEPVATSHPKIRSRIENEDAAWLKFVLSEPEEEDQDQPLQEAFRLPKRTRKAPTWNKTQSQIVNPAQSTPASSSFDSPSIDKSSRM